MCLFSDYGVAALFSRFDLLNLTIFECCKVLIKFSWLFLDLFQTDAMIVGSNGPSLTERELEVRPPTTSLINLSIFWPRRLLMFILVQYAAY